jgi:GDP-mannose transporter
MTFLNVPSAISTMQIVFAAVLILAMKYIGRVEVDDFELERLKPYSLYIVAFVSAIYANMMALSVSNVETVIVFRACTPLAVSIIDYLFMGRAYPSKRSTASLLGVFAFAVVYCMSDSEFSMKGFGAYTWVSIYFVLITFEMTYGKKLTQAVKMKSVWGPVLYCNALSALPMFLIGYIPGEFDGISERMQEIPSSGMAIIMFSCVVGTLIGYTGWRCRGMVSATSYTLIGVVNKFLTVLLNVFLWDKHSSPMGLVAVCGCLVAGMFYEQAPMRSDSHKTDGAIADAPKDAILVGESPADAEEEEAERLIEITTAAPRRAALSNV